MQHHLQAAWDERIESLPLKSPYEALILASIVEKETGLESDRAEIAGVFVNRLRIGMRLQTDPTVIYGMGDQFDGNLRKKICRRIITIIPIPVPACHLRPLPCPAWPLFAPL